jgi:DNA-binding MarR family transcriptional regulator
VSPVRFRCSSTRRTGARARSIHGRAKVDAAATEHVANEERLLTALTDDERSTLDDLLRRLLAAVENEVADRA